MEISWILSKQYRIYSVSLKRVTGVSKMYYIIGGEMRDSQIS